MLLEWLARAGAPVPGPDRERALSELARGIADTQRRMLTAASQAERLALENRLQFSDLVTPTSFPKPPAGVDRILVFPFTSAALGLPGGAATVPEGPTPAGATTFFNTSCAGPLCTVTARTAAQTGSNNDCSDVGCAFGPWLSIANGGLSTCVRNTFAQPGSGTVNSTTGNFDGSIPLQSAVTVTGVGANPCPDCVAGACGAGSTNVGAACTGFLAALSQAAALVEVGRAERILVIGAESLTRMADLDDKKTAMLWGDGAGAVDVDGRRQEALEGAALDDLDEQAVLGGAAVDGDGGEADARRGNAEVAVEGVADGGAGQARIAAAGVDDDVFEAAEANDLALGVSLRAERFAAKDASVLEDDGGVPATKVHRVAPPRQPSSGPPGPAVSSPAAACWRSSSAASRR